MFGITSSSAVTKIHSAIQAKLCDQSVLDIIIRMSREPDLF